MCDKQIKELIGKIYLSNHNDPHQEFAAALGVPRAVAKQLFWRAMYNTHMFNMVKGVVSE